ncbi:hypothetical protein [Spirulina sp. 06S082]|uniref:hypothetical protein n=1 Tax=Spirulina sp. 06S082 TaxID=3110248 RepID=UPI002B20CAD5|nr:hypothetical protein [Spirulina sp. 06S082]MEA5467240.1 hypothetical protein [Spirulina sp. 06S082]
MKKLFQVNFTQSNPPKLSSAERKQQIQANLEQEKQRGYTQLTELCRLGEIDAAKHLASRNSRWGYEIIDGVVFEKLEE